MPFPERATRSPARARAGALAASLLTALAGALVAVSASAAPAQAADTYDPDARYGYAKVAEPETYLHDVVVFAKMQVLHVDTEHMDADGFWYAVQSGMFARGFQWQYQPFGMWCGGSAQKVEWNPWMNTHGCGYDWPKAEAAFPGIIANTEACRASTGHPWKYGWTTPGTCTDSAVGSGSKVYMEPGYGAECAPWEDQGVNAATGSAKCRAQRYAWENITPNSFWSPAPDTCTGLPADANKNPIVPPALYSYLPAGPVPDCTGAALASNCPPDSLHQSCTGVPTTFQSRTATASATTTSGLGVATATRTATATATAYKVTRTVKKTYKGKTYKASKTVALTAKATKSATATVTITDGTATRTATASCTRLTDTLAQSCAQSTADAQAGTAAREAATSDAKARAETDAADLALRNATTMATSKAKSTRVSKAQKTAAAKKAIKQATRAVNKQIAKAKKR